MTRLPTRSIARCLCGLGLVLVLAEVVGAVAVASLVRTPFGTVISGFTLTNVVISTSLGTCGALLAWHRPRLAIGWLLLGSGVAQGATGVAGAVLTAGVHDGWTGTPMRLAATAFSWGWPWAMGLGFPLAMLLFPTGSPAGPRWRPFVRVVPLIGVGFALGSGLDPTSSRFDGVHLVPHLGAWSGYHHLAALWGLIDALNALLPLAVLVSLVLRYRRGDDTMRRQLLWVLLAALLVVLVVVPTVVLQAGSELLVGVVALVPVSIVIAVQRHNLLDIRFVVARTLSWSLLTAVLVGVYLTTVSVVGEFFLGRGDALVVAALVALAVNPLRARLQTGIDRMLFGDRRDPAALLRRVGPALGPTAELVDLVAAVATSLRLPYAALRADGRDVAVVGDPPAVLQRVPLRAGDEEVGALVVGLRPGQQHLSRSDLAALDVLSTPAALALRSTLLAEQLRQSQVRVVRAREEERRRLRRDLHDGLGPVLTSVAFRSDAARNYVHTRPDEATGLLDKLRGEVDTALAEVRRLVQALRPATLDDVGFGESLVRLADGFPRRSDGTALTITVHVPPTLPPLPEAIETTAYRIVAEALVNVVRHSVATEADVEVSADTHLRVIIRDNGAGSASWTPGVGMTSMRERAAEVGGAAEAGPAEHGGVVQAVLPLPTHGAR